MRSSWRAAHARSITRHLRSARGAHTRRLRNCAPLGAAVAFGALGSLREARGQLAPWEASTGCRTPATLPDNGRRGRAAAVPHHPGAAADADRGRRVHIPGLLTPEWLAYPGSDRLAGGERPLGRWSASRRGCTTTSSGRCGPRTPPSPSSCTSPLASALAGLGDAKELRITDLLMVNPNKGFKWHQDNQNGPIDAFAENTALRWW